MRFKRVASAVIYQEFNLDPVAQTVRENIFLGQESGLLARKGLETKRAKDLLAKLGSSLDPERLAGRLSVADQQLVEIAKALAVDAQILVMDEPTAALTPQEVDALHRVTDELRTQGLGIIYISHRLDEVFRITDRVLVLRDGERVSLRDTSDTTRRELIEAMVGRTIENEFPKEAAPIGEPRLRVNGLSRGDEVRDVSFEVHAGEVLGIAGLVGAGRSETARLVFGADRATTGSVELDGRTLRVRSPRDAIRAGVGFLTEDRKGQGLIPLHSVSDNFALPNLPRFSTAGVLSLGAVAKRWAHFVGALGIKVAHPRVRVGNLSGGNQQKVVLAKWLESECDVLIFDEPTRGIDVGAKYEIYLLMNELAKAGKAIIMISSELPEILGMSDRILVMHEGRVTGDVQDVANATQEQLLELAVG